MVSVQFYKAADVHKLQGQRLDSWPYFEVSLDKTLNPEPLVP